MSDSLKLIARELTDYQEDGEDAEFVVVEVTINGSSARFKIPATADSSGGFDFNFSEATKVKKIKKTVEVWE